MNRQYLIANLIGLLLFAGACNNSQEDYDASGSFEAVERIISSEATGRIEYLEVEEGGALAANDTIGAIDVSLLQLQAEQVQASIHAFSSKTNDATPQVHVLEAQLSTQKSETAYLREQLIVIDKEISRFEKLVSAKAAPQKQLDDIVGQKDVLRKKIMAAETQGDIILQQIKAARANVNRENRSILSGIEPAKKSLDIIERRIKDGIIINRYPGTVITKYVYDGEFTSIGKPLYKIADLSEMILRVYISGNQLAQIKLNDIVRVFTDDGNGGYRETEGIVEWISNSAEFTPKTIQTKDERANLVYAIKVKVVNDGRFKIGMYGKIKFAADV